MAHNFGRFHFDGGAGTYLGTGILAALITICTAGICYPFALVLLGRWRCKHTCIDGQRLVFSGTGVGLFGLWIRWFLIIVVTVGIYSFWVAPRIQQWKVENTGFDPTWQPNTLGRSAAPAAAIQSPRARPAITNV
jgi:uncharacterized membrane protein YjgN (DUF898 family)